MPAALSAATHSLQTDTLQPTLRRHCRLSRCHPNSRPSYSSPGLEQARTIDGLTYFIAMRGIYPDRKALADFFYDPFIGTIARVAYESAYLPPEGWLRCDVQVMPIERMSHRLRYSEATVSERLGFPICASTNRQRLDVHHRVAGRYPELQ
jgi:hypothetical protein